MNGFIEFCVLKNNRKNTLPFSSSLSMPHLPHPSSHITAGQLCKYVCHNLESCLRSCGGSRNTLFVVFFFSIHPSNIFLFFCCDVLWSAD